MLFVLRLSVCFYCIYLIFFMFNEEIELCLLYGYKNYNIYLIIIIFDWFCFRFYILIYVEIEDVIMKFIVCFINE